MMTAIECRTAAEPLWNRAQHFRMSLPALAEAGWFLVALTLFMVLGPFAAPVALFAVFGLDSEHRGSAEPEAAE